MKYRRQPFGCKPLHIGTFARRDDPKEKLDRFLMIDNLAAYLGYVELRFVQCLKDFPLMLSDRGRGRWEEV